MHHTILNPDLALFLFKYSKNENYVIQTKMPKICEDISVLKIIIIIVVLEQRNNIVHFASTLQNSGRKKGSLSARAIINKLQLRLRGPSRRSA